jgi:hypothetical protein
MTPATRLALHTFAAASVVAMPFVVLAIARWAARGPAGRSVPLTAWLVPALALLSGAAGVIHLLVIEDHLVTSRLHGAMFAALAAFQLTWAVWFAARPGRVLAVLALLVNAGTIGVWLLSRISGLPGWLEGEGPEPVGLADLAATVMELGLVAGLLALSWGPMRRRWVDGRAVTRADAGLAMAMVTLAVVLGTLASIASIASGGHGHAGDEASVGARRSLSRLGEAQEAS